MVYSFGEGCKILIVYHKKQWDSLVPLLLNLGYTFSKLEGVRHYFNGLWDNQAYFNMLCLTPDRQIIGSWIAGFEIKEMENDILIIDDKLNYSKLWKFLGVKKTKKYRNIEL